MHAITSGHRSISGQFTHVTDHVYTVRMSVQGSQVKKRSVLKKTVDKWIAQNDKALSTTVWLKYDTDRADRTRVTSLKNRPARNYTSAFVDGSGKLRSSSFKDHAASIIVCHILIRRLGEGGSLTRSFMQLRYSCFSFSQDCNLLYCRRCLHSRSILGSLYRSYMSETTTGVLCPLLVVKLGPSMCTTAWKQSA